MQRAGLALPLPNYSVEAETNKDGHFELEVRDTKQGLVTLVAPKQGYTTCSLLWGKRSARSASMKDVATPAPHIGKWLFRAWLIRAHEARRPRLITLPPLLKAIFS